jgi:hypothetical protein
VLFCFGGWLVVSKRLDPGSSKLARDDTVYSLGVLVLGCVHHQHVTTTPPHHESSFSPFHLSTSKTPFHLSTSKTPFHLQRSCHPRSVFAQRMKQKTPAALRGFILVGGKFRQGFIKVYFLMGLKAPISAAFGPLALMD